MNDNKFWYWDSVISKEVCDLALKDLDFQKAEQAEIRDDSDNYAEAANRKTSIVWQPNTSVIGCVINTFARVANVSAGWNYQLDISEAIQLGKYEAGNGHYDWHADTLLYGNSKQRKLSVGILLNDPTEFEGGAFDFEGGDEDVLKNRGSIVVFPSHIRHRVAPVTSGVRYSAVGWVVGDLFR